LTTANVARLRRRWRVHLDAVADNAPIVVGGRLYQTAKNGTTYAIDTATGRILWRFRTEGPNITTSVPAFDASENVLYVPGVDGFVHKLDPQTGKEIRGGGFPVRILTAPQTEKNASPLNLAHGYLYAQTSGYFGDATPYVGHVVAIRLSDGSEHVFNTLCSGRHRLIDPATCPQQRSGMWSRSGVVVDPDPAMGGRVYVATGNGPFDPSIGSYGDALLALTPDVSRLLGYYAPTDYDELEASDLDLGSSSPVLLPRQPASTTPLMAVQGGKDAILRLVDRAHLGGVGHALQSIRLADQLFSAPAVWNDRSGTTWVFVGLRDGIYAYHLTTRGGKSRLVRGWHAALPTTRLGTSPIVDNGILFAAASGALVALDAANGRRLWSSDALGPIHWESPAVADGMVFCSDEDGDVTAFGL
jgi:outer membrane protein assembly factor BamB